jgi:hypothetical protein
MATTAPSCISGSTLRYVSMVSEIFAWPSFSCTTLGYVPLDRSSVANVWRRSWKRIRGGPARCSSGLKER